MARGAEGGLKIPAIPTFFDGVQFRSRLEAKVAAFFAIVGWQADYEPLDLAGYVPDFLLRFARGNVAVEVKPIAWDDTESDDEFIEPAKAKFASWPGEALIVGAFVQERFGLIRVDGIWQPAFTFLCIDCGCKSFAAEDDSWHCRVNGCYLGKKHMDLLGWDRVADFKKAANMVQWRAPR